MPPFVSPVAGGTITFHWIPEPEKIAWDIARMADRLENRQPPLQVSRQIAADDTREHFDTETSPDGEAWAPWDPDYARTRGPGMILNLTGALRAAVTQLGAYPVTVDSLFFDTSVMPDYGFMNYFGSGAMAGLTGASAHSQRVDEDGNYIKLEDPATGQSTRTMSGAGRGGALPSRPMVGISFEAQLQILEVFEAWFDGVINTTWVRGGRIMSGFKDPTTGRFAKAPK